MKQLLCLVLATIWTAGAAGAADFHVSTAGDDAWSGRLAAPNATRTDGPFASPNRARDAVRARIAAGLQANVRVEFRGGTYYLPDGLQLGLQDSGTASHSITYTAAPGEEVSLVGGLRITDWKPYKGEIWQADLPAGLDTQQAFENGVRLELARTPNEGYLHMEGPVAGASTKAFTYAAGDLDPDAWNIDGARVYSWPGHDWFSNEEQIESIDAKTRTIVKARASGYEMRAGNRYFVRNVLALLDTPGEVHIDTRARKIYCWPRRGPIHEQVIVVSTVPHVISVEGETDDKPVQNVHFQGLNISSANKDVVRFTRAQDSSVRACKIENGGASGVAVAGAARRIRIADNLIRFHGQHGVSLTGLAPGQPDLNSHHVVENNHIHHCGRLVGHGYGVEISQSGHNRVLHNRIHHMPRYGTSIKGMRFQSLREQVKGVTWENHYDYLHSRNNLLAFNHIHHVNQDSQDTGAMESWGPGRDNVYDHNLIHDSGNNQFDLQSGFYLDDASDYFTLTNNIVWGIRGAGGDQPAYLKGIGHKVRNNVFIVEPDNTGAIRSMTMAGERTDNHEYTHNIIAFEDGPTLPRTARGSFGQAAAELHAQGTTLRWKVTVPIAGDYTMWMLYAAHNAPYGRTDMGGATTMGVDNAAPVVLQNLPDTGDWNRHVWSRSATLKLRQGEQELRWTNVQGGGLNWDAFVLTDDPQWVPDPPTPSLRVAPPAAGRNLIVVQAESFIGSVKPESRRWLYNFDNWSQDRVTASDYNVFWSPGADMAIRGGPGAGGLDAWKKASGNRFEVHSVVADPLFVNAATRDYRLQPNSPALKLGFNPIDIGRIGLTAEFPARFPRE